VLRPATPSKWEEFNCFSMSCLLVLLVDSSVIKLGRRKVIIVDLETTVDRSQRNEIARTTTRSQPSRTHILRYNIDPSRHISLYFLSFTPKFTLIRSRDPRSDLMSAAEPKPECSTMSTGPRYKIGDKVYLARKGDNYQFSVRAVEYSFVLKKWKYRLQNLTEKDCRSTSEIKTKPEADLAFPWSYEEDIMPWVGNLIDL